MKFKFSTYSSVDFPTACEHGETAVRPLHYWRSSESSELIRGKSIYVTHNAHYEIIRRRNGWEVKNLFAPREEVARIAEAGLFVLTFPRRCDLLEALESVLEASV